MLQICLTLRTTRLGLKVLPFLRMNEPRILGQLTMESIQINVIEVTTEGSGVALNVVRADMFSVLIGGCNSFVPRALR